MIHDDSGHGCCGAQGKHASAQQLLFGFDASWNFFQFGPAAGLLQEMGFNFWNVYYPGLFQDEREKGTTVISRHIDAIGRIGAWCAAAGLEWTADLEQANGVLECRDDRGRDWFNRSDGRHFQAFPGEVQDAFAGCSSFLGLRYDEPEWMQIGRHFYSGLNRHFFWNPGGGTLESAAEEFTRAAEEIAVEHSRHGVNLFSEHVFPVLLHCFARAGFTPAMKILKENWAAPCLAIAIGAALQYGRRLWITPDMWGVRGYLDHSVEEYEGALKLAYHMGAEAIYTECLAGRQKDNLVLISGNEYEIRPHGLAAGRFIREYVPANPRGYSFRDVRPRVAVIRQPDSCWGQASSWTPDRLFGNDAWTSTSITEAWLRLWHLLTNGCVHADSLTWHGNSYGFWNEERGGVEHQSFCPLEGVVVFDHLVAPGLLEGVEVVFLTGIGISSGTLEGVAGLVAGGATCVALPHLLPDDIRRNSGNGEFSARDGAGLWVATNDFLAPHVRKAVKDILPEPNLIRYRFRNTEINMKCGFANPDRLDIDTRNV